MKVLIFDKEAFEKFVEVYENYFYPYHNHILQTIVNDLKDGDYVAYALPFSTDLLSMKIHLREFNFVDESIVDEDGNVYNLVRSEVDGYKHPPYNTQTYIHVSEGSIILTNKDINKRSVVAFVFNGLMHVNVKSVTYDAIVFSPTTSYPKPAIRGVINNA